METYRLVDLVTRNGVEAYNLETGETIEYKPQISLGLFGGIDTALFRGETHEGYFMTNTFIPIKEYNRDVPLNELRDRAFIHGFMNRYIGIRPIDTRVEEIRSVAALAQLTTLTRMAVASHKSFNILNNNGWEVDVESIYFGYNHKHGVRGDLPLLYMSIEIKCLCGTTEVFIVSLRPETEMRGDLDILLLFYLCGNMGYKHLLDDGYPEEFAKKTTMNIHSDFTQAYSNTALQVHAEAIGKDLDEIRRDV